MIVPRWLVARFAAALCLMAVACGGDNKGRGNTDASISSGDTATSEELDLAKGAQALRDLKSFRFDMSRTMDAGDPGGGSSEDEAGAALLRLLSTDVSAKGAYAGPDSFEVETSLFGQTMRMVQIGDEAWVNGGSGWKVTDAEDMSDSDMTSPADLLEMVPAEVLKGATVRPEKVNGQETTRYSFNKDQVMQLAQNEGEGKFNMEDIDEMNLDIWMTKDGIPVKMVMKVKSEAERGSAEIKTEYNVTDLNDPGIKIQKPL